MYKNKNEKHWSHVYDRATHSQGHFLLSLQLNSRGFPYQDHYRTRHIHVRELLILFPKQIFSSSKVCGDTRNSLLYPTNYEYKQAAENTPKYFKNTK